MGRNAGVAADPKQAVDRFTEEAIVSGDLLWMGEDGLAKKIPAVLPVDLFGRNTSGLSVYKAFGAAAADILGSSFPGTIVYISGFIFQVYHTTSGSGVTLVKKTLDGDIVSTTSVSAGTPISYRIVKLSTSSLSVVWATNTAISCRNYDLDLNTLSSVVTVESSNNFYDFDLFNACALSTGKLLVVWRTNTGSDCLASIYNEDGSVVAADISIFSTGTPTAITCCKLDSGGFAVSWFSTTHQFARFDSAGNMVGSIVSISGSTNTADTSINGERLLHLSNNSVAIQYYTATAKPQFAIYDSSNTLVVAVNPAAHSNQNEKEAAMTLTDDGFAFIVMTSTTNCQITRVTNAGVVSGLASVVFSSAPLVRNLHFIPGVGFALTGNNTIALVDTAGELVGSVITPTLTEVISILAEEAVLYVAGYNTTYHDTVYTVGRSCIAGVALNSATSSKVKVATRGVYTLTESYGNGAVFDCSSYVLEGAQGVVHKNRATLFGVSE